MSNLVYKGKNLIFTSNSFIFLFLFYNALKLYQISTDLRIQLLNLLLSIGIIFLLEDRNKKIFGFENFKGLNRYFGIAFFVIIFARSLYLTTYDDKFYYFLLPSGISSILTILFDWKDINFYKNVVIIAFLLPFRRAFVFFLNFLLLPLTKYLTWIVLLSIGKEPILIGRSIFINQSELIIGEACLGSDNLFFVICTVYIYFTIFKLRSFKNIRLIAFLTVITPVLVNVFRNVLLALIVSIDSNYKDEIFDIFHDSYGSVLFSLISVFIVSKAYFSMLNTELNK